MAQTRLFVSAESSRTTALCCAGTGKAIESDTKYAEVNGSTSRGEAGGQKVEHFAHHDKANRQYNDDDFELF